MENTYTFIIGIFTLVVVLIYFVGFFIPGREKLVDIFVLLMVFISIFIVWRYHPIRYVSYIGEESHWYFGDSEMGLELLAAGGDVHMIFYYLLYLTIPILLFLAIQNFKSKAGTSNDKAFRIFSIIALIFLAIMIATSFNPSSLKQLSFSLMSIGVILLLLNQYKDGISEGKEAKIKDNGFFKKMFAYISFFYFTIKVVIESYKAINSVDPFIILDEKASVSLNVLGALVPLLLGWGIPQSVINIVAIIFSDYLTIILIGITVVKEAFQTDGNIYSKLSAGIWVIFLWFAVDTIHFPFFTMTLSILYVAAWMTGNIHGEILKKVKDEEEGKEKTNKKNKSKNKHTEQNIKPVISPEQAKKNLIEQLNQKAANEESPNFGYNYSRLPLYEDIDFKPNFQKIIGEIVPASKIYFLYKDLVTTEEDITYIRIQVHVSDNTKMWVTNEDEDKVISDNCRMWKAIGWIRYDETTFKALNITKYT